MNYLTFATNEKFQNILENEHIIEDLRIPKRVRDSTRNIIIQGQVWGRRGNTKLITVIIFSGMYNNNKEMKNDINNLIMAKDPGAKLVYNDTDSTLALNILSRNLTNVLKGVAETLKYLEDYYGITKELSSVNISTDLPNWKGTNYYTSDPLFLLQITQMRETNSQYGVFHIDPEELDDLILLMIIQTAINLYPRVIIKTELTQVSKRFLINRIEDLVLETRSQLNTSLLKDIIYTVEANKGGPDSV